jgi:hypothetical protein
MNIFQKNHLLGESYDFCLTVPQIIPSCYINTNYVATQRNYLVKCVIISHFSTNKVKQC